MAGEERRVAALTEALAEYEAAVEAQAEAEAAVQEVAVEAGFVDEADFDIEDYDVYLDDAQESVEAATQALAEARQDTFGVGDFNTASLNTTFDNARQSDARLQQLVDAAQAAVRADTDRYDEDGTTNNVDGAFTARQLQSQLNAANSTLQGDVTRNGETLEVAGNLSNAISAFLAQLATGEDDFGLEQVQDDYRAVLAAIEDEDGDMTAAPVQTALDAWKVSVDASIAAAFDGAELDGGTPATIDGRGEFARADVEDGVPAAIADLLFGLNTRFTNEERVEDREGAFDATTSGGDYLAAVELQEARETVIQDLADAEAVVEALETAFAEYEDAVAAVDAAAEALGFEVVTVDDGILFGEADEAELFIFNADSLDDLGITDVTVNELEAGDALFFGTDYALGGETGNNNQLEFFVTTNVAGDVVLEVENSAFGSANDDVYNVTLTGISEDQLNIDGGVVTIVEVA